MSPFAILALEAARLYLEFARDTAGMTEADAKAAWEKTQARVADAWALFDRAGEVSRG